MEEIWAEVEGYPNYAVSNTGKVFNINTNRPLSYRRNEEGYCRVVLSEEGDRRDWYVHHLVAQAFFAEYRAGCHISHVNGDKTNNHVANLRYRRDSRAAILERKRIKRRVWGRKVRVRETGDIYRNVRECANAIEGDYSSIYSCLRGEQKHHKGYTFEYYAR